MLLLMNSQNPMCRLRACVDATYQAAATVTTREGNRTSLILIR
jgi:hypothetical protein